MGAAAETLRGGASYRVGNLGGKGGNVGDFGGNIGYSGTPAHTDTGCVVHPDPGTLAPAQSNDPASLKCTSFPMQHQRTAPP
eukprot:7163427-Prymnesium_polylepis.2